MLVYLICLLVLGLPVLTMEFSIGRAAQVSPVQMLKKLEKPGGKWGFYDYLSLLGNLSLMAFFTVVTGWIISYFYKYVTGDMETWASSP